MMRCCPVREKVLPSRCQMNHWSLAEPNWYVESYQISGRWPYGCCCLFFVCLVWSQCPCGLSLGQPARLLHPPQPLVYRRPTRRLVLLSHPVSALSVWWLSCAWRLSFSGLPPGSGFLLLLSAEGRVFFLPRSTSGGRLGTNWFSWYGARRGAGGGWRFLALVAWVVGRGLDTAAVWLNQISRWKRPHRSSSSFLGSAPRSVPDEHPQRQARGCHERWGAGGQTQATA
jgi:hypothetical protein